VTGAPRLRRHDNKAQNLPKQPGKGRKDLPPSKVRGVFARISLVIGAAAKRSNSSYFFRPTLCVSSCPFSHPLHLLGFILLSLSQQPSPVTFFSLRLGDGFSRRPHESGQGYAKRIMKAAAAAELCSRMGWLGWRRGTGIEDLDPSVELK